MVWGEVEHRCLRASTFMLQATVLKGAQQVLVSDQKNCPQSRTPSGSRHGIISCAAKFEALAVPMLKKLIMQHATCVDTAGIAPSNTVRKLNSKIDVLPWNYRAHQVQQASRGQGSNMLYRLTWCGRTD